jgi:uncharacterized protein
MHVYHYGAYEPTALKQLMGVYATREDAVDALLRREVFVDLHRVVRQGLRVGVPGYSLKEVEALPPFQRRADVTSGTRAVLTKEQWMQTHAAARLDEIAAYNEEDCRATLALREWLLKRRPDDARWAAPPDARPVDDDRQKTDAQREALRQALLDGAVAGSPRWLAAELLEYHRREARPAWWWFFERCQMSADELVEDGEAIGRRRPEGVPRAVNRSIEYRFRRQPGDAASRRRRASAAAQRPPAHAHPAEVGGDDRSGQPHARVPARGVPLRRRPDSYGTRASGSLGDPGPAVLLL